uniref:SFRICE_035518 n=1 Tax=Spodoptera frugiperda TaxID=7108 RepID=A0A2H1W5P0_SPOFR
MVWLYTVFPHNRGVVNLM